MRVDHLDRYHAPQVGIGGFIHGRHAALPEHLLDDVALAQGFSDQSGFSHYVLSKKQKSLLCNDYEIFALMITQITRGIRPARAYSGTPDPASRHSHRFRFSLVNQE